MKIALMQLKKKILFKILSFFLTLLLLGYTPA